MYTAQTTEKFSAGASTLRGRVLTFVLFAVGCITSTFASSQSLGVSINQLQWLFAQLTDGLTAVWVHCLLRHHWAFKKLGKVILGK